MPKIDRNTGKPYNDRYILGADPYDDDESNTMSLGSIFVLDLWTDRIVAEYTGRPSLLMTTMRFVESSAYSIMVG